MEEIKDLRNKLKQELLNSYYKKVHAQILPLEKLRVSLLFIVIIAYLILFSILYYIISSIKILWNNEHSIILFISIVIITIIPIFINAIKGFYKRKLKKFYPQIIESIGLKYCTENGVHSAQNAIINSELFPTANQTIEDDIFYGKYKDIGITISEAQVIDSGDSHGNMSESKSATTLFNGIIISLDSNKEIKSTTLIKPKRDLLILKKLPINFITLFWAIVGFCLIILGISYAIEDKNLSNCMPSLSFGIIFFVTFGWWFYESAIKRELRQSKYLQKLMLEDINFSKYYQAYSYNQIEGRYLITTAFMDRFTYLGNVFNTKNLRCSFVNNN